jgi:hypothetical protein
MSVTQTGQGAGPSANVVQVTRELSLESSQEPGVAIPEREYDRLIDRLAGCKAGGWADIWLAGIGLGGGLGTAALVTVLSLGTTVAGSTKVILWMLVIIGVVILVLSLSAYLTQRKERGKEIDVLMEDMKMHRPRTS